MIFVLGGLMSMMFIFVVCFGSVFADLGSFYELNVVIKVVICYCLLYSILWEGGKIN
jgi:hypothetical protein